MTVKKTTKKKTNYELLVKPRLKDIEDFASNNVTERTMAKKLGVSYSSFCKYKVDNKELKEALNHGRASLVDKSWVAVQSIALGYHYTEQQTIKLKDSGFDENGKKWEVERYEVVDVERYSKPDLAANIVIQKNYNKKDITGQSFTNLDEVSEKMKEREIKIKEDAADDGF